jgi:hypothetical protein
MPGRHGGGMPGFLVGWLFGLGGAAVGLVVAALTFSEFDLDSDGFVLALLVFAVLSVTLLSVVFKALRRHAGSIVPLSGLISTFLALWLTDLVSEGLTIDGTGTLFGSALLIWVLSMVIWLLPGPWHGVKKADSARR